MVKKLLIFCFLLQSNLCFSFYTTEPEWIFAPDPNDSGMPYVTIKYTRNIFFGLNKTEKRENLYPTNESNCEWYFPNIRLCARIAQEGQHGYDDKYHMNYDGERVEDSTVAFFIGPNGEKVTYKPAKICVYDDPNMLLTFPIIAAISDPARMTEKFLSFDFNDLGFFHQHYHKGERNIHWSIRALKWLPELFEDQALYGPFYKEYIKPYLSEANRATSPFKPKTDKDFSNCVMMSKVGEYPPPYCPTLKLNFRPRVLPICPTTLYETEYYYPDFSRSDPVIASDLNNRDCVKSDTVENTFFNRAVRIATSYIVGLCEASKDPDCAIIKNQKKRRPIYDYLVTLPVCDNQSTGKVCVQLPDLGELTKSISTVRVLYGEKNKGDGEIFDCSEYYKNLEPCKSDSTETCRAICGFDIGYFIDYEANLSDQFNDDSLNVSKAFDAGLDNNIFMPKTSLTVTFTDRNIEVKDRSGSLIGVSSFAKPQYIEIQKDESAPWNDLKVTVHVKEKYIKKDKPEVAKSKTFAVNNSAKSMGYEIGNIVATYRDGPNKDKALFFPFNNSKDKPLSITTSGPRNFVYDDGKYQYGAEYLCLDLNAPNENLNSQDFLCAEISESKVLVHNAICKSPATKDEKKNCKQENIRGRNPMERCTRAQAEEAASISGAEPPEINRKLCVKAAQPPKCPTNKATEAVEVWHEAEYNTIQTNTCYEDDKKQKPYQCSRACEITKGQDGKYQVKWGPVVRK